MASNRRLGALREALHFQKRGTGADGFGNSLEGQGAWVTQFTVAASMIPLRGTEAVMAARLNGRQPYVVAVRHTEDMRGVTPAWRVVDQRNTSRVFDIASPLADPDGKRQWLEFIAVEGTPAAGEAHPAPAAPVVTTAGPIVSASGEIGPIEGTGAVTATILIAMGEISAAVDVAPDGTWEWQPPALADGSYQLTATQRIASGPVSAASPPLQITVDTAAPASPVIASPVSPFVTTNREPEFSGTAEPLSTVTLYLDGEAAGTAEADANGAWAHEFDELEFGTYEVTATATDAAGNESAPSAAVVLTVNPPLAVAGTPKLRAVVGEDYEWFFTVTGGVPPFTPSHAPLVPGLGIEEVSPGLFRVHGPLTDAGLYEEIVIDIEDSE